MTKKDVLDSLRNFSENFPKEALREIQVNKANFISELLESLDYAYHNAEELYDEESEYFLHTYAMYLLAEFREKKAFPYLIELLRLPDDYIDFVLGDFFFEDFPRLLLCTFDNANIQMLLDIIENSELNEWARVSAIKAYELLYRESFVGQEEFVSYLRSLIYDKLREDDSFHVFTFLVGSVIDTHLVQMIQDVRFLYDNDRVDTSVYGKYDDFIDCIFYEDRPEKSHYIHDTLSEMEQWNCFNQKSEKSKGQFEKGIVDFMSEEIKKDRQQDKMIVQKQKEAGRNDPCPCGSGKKYKKCCYDLHQKNSSIIRLEDKYDLLERYPKDLPLFKKMYEEEAIHIDMLVYKALHHRAIPIWVERDREQERVGKINYLKEALDLFLDKCQREQITSFSAYDEQYMVHYRSYEWVSALIDLIKDNDSLELIGVKKTAIDTLRNFEQ